MITYSDAKRNRDIVVYSLVFIAGIVLCLLGSLSPVFGGAGVGLLIASTSRGTGIWYKVKMRNLVPPRSLDATSATEFARGSDIHA